MADVKDKAARSRNMAAIKSKNTKPEETVRKYLFSKGFRYRKNDSRLIGKPDIVLPKYKTVIFVNGSFISSRALAAIISVSIFRVISVTQHIIVLPFIRSVSFVLRCWCLLRSLHLTYTLYIAPEVNQSFYAHTK